MPRKGTGLSAGWWISPLLFLLIVAVAYVAWWVPSHRAAPPLEVKFAGERR